MPLERHRLVLHSGINPGTMTVEIDGKPIRFVSHVELTVDSQGFGEAKLTIPAALLDIEVDAAAFLTAHSDQDSVQVGKEIAPAGCAASFRDVRGNLRHCNQAADHYDETRKPIWATSTGPIDANGWHTDGETIWPDTSPGATPHATDEGR